MALLWNLLSFWRLLLLTVLWFFVISPAMHALSWWCYTTYRWMLP